MHARFHAPDARKSGEVVTLTPEESAHLVRVLRLGPGDEVRLFNGRGGEFAGVVDSASKNEVRVRVGQSCRAAAEARVAITLGQAVLKGEQMDEAIRDAVMIGATAIQPIVTVRSEVRAGTLERGHRRARWERIAVASAKQCGRAVVPAVLAPLTLDAVIAAKPVAAVERTFMLVEPGASSVAVSLGNIDARPPKTAFVAIGPEGGWMPEETEAAARVWQLVTLGGRTLRARSMALVVLSAFYARWGEF